MEDCIERENIEEEDIDEPSGSAATRPSFRGRLNLADYTFSPKLNIKDESSPLVPRRGPRNPVVQLSIPCLKRKLSDLVAPEPHSPLKKSRSQSGYAPPSTYAHLPTLPDALGLDLICVFVGLNPGIQTAVSGHAYAHPSNLFWKLLHSSGCTTRRCLPEEDQDLPRLFALGNTNIVTRPTRNGSELSKAEMDASVRVLEEKIRRFRPEAVCIVGKSIWESVWRVRHGRAIKKDEFKYGWQDEGENMGAISEDGDEWKGARVFAATSTSGLAASLLPAEKERIWRELGVWVEQRRTERGILKVEDIP